MRTRIASIIICCVGVALGSTVSRGADDRVAVLGQGTNWRIFVGWKTPEVIDEQGRVTLAKIEIRHGYRKTGKNYPMLQSRPPAAGWNQPDFDDGGWVRGSSYVSHSQRPSKWPLSSCMPVELHPVLARGRLVVADPAKAGDLRLSVNYIGGAVVYLNGHEIARGHLPKGPLTWDTLAEAYPLEAYRAPDGFMLDGRFKEFPKQHALRRRTLKDVALPRERLVKGVNVVAVEIHRSPMNKIRLTLKEKKRGWKGAPTPWAHAALGGVVVTAPAGSAAVPNVARPAGMQVWTAPVAQKVNPKSYGDRVEAAPSVRIVAARNGVFSGQVVVGSSKPIIAPSARIAGALKHENGRDGIAADAVSIRYAKLHTSSVSRRKKRWVWFDALAEVAPGKVPEAVQPIWVSIRVPRDAAFGKYIGTVAIDVAGKRVADVPVELTVQNFTLPDPGSFATHVGLVQSPETLAIEYKLPLWSEKHWALIERSLRLTGELGNETLYIPLMCRYHFGNAESMVRWVRRPDGEWGHDFSLVEKYVDLARKHLPKLRVVCFIAWDRWTGSSRTPAGKRRLIPVSTLDPKTGAIGEAKAPAYGTPESRAFWKPVYDGLKALLEKRGLAKTMMHGIAGDTAPYSEVYADLRAVAPLPWVWQGHPRNTKLGPKDKPIPVGYGSWVWGTPVVPEPLQYRLYGWKAAMTENTFPRAGSSCFGAMRTWADFPLYRASTEALTTAGMRGFGRVGADFWPVTPAAAGANIRAHKGKKYSLVHRFPASWGQLQLTNSTSYLLYPGKDGAIGSARFEMIREGLQEAETRALIERALLNKAHRAKLGTELAERCESVLDDRARTLTRGTGGSWAYYLTGLSRRTAELFAIAGEAQRALRD